MLTKYGTDNIVIMLIAGVLILAIGYYVDKLFLSIPLYIIGVAIIALVFIFFRDPDRTLPMVAINDDSYIIAPADGEVVEIIEVEENDYLKQRAKRLSIFLSPIDVHVNRNPVTGIVEYYQYVPGEYLVAYHPKSSELNEHSKIGVLTRHGKVMYKQIVGILARRIVCDVKVKDSVVMGDRFGMMKFGSRMDIFVPLDCEFFVKVNDKVVAGETILGRMKQINE
jgi:phosphatidylserine decarboxylase